MVTEPASTQTARGVEKRELIVEVAMRRFAANGYEGARIEDIADELGIAKGSIFHYFGSKEGLLFACFKYAVSSLHAWLDVPEDVKKGGFFQVLEYWLDRSEHLAQADRAQYAVLVIA